MNGDYWCKKTKNIIIEDDRTSKLLDEATENARNSQKRYSHEEVFSKARSIVNGAKKV